MNPILFAISSWVKLDRMRISPHALCLSCALQESGHPHLVRPGLAWERDRPYWSANGEGSVVGWTPGCALIATLRSWCPGVQRSYASRIVATSHVFGDGPCWHLRVSARRSLHRRSSSKLHSTQRGCKHRLFIPTERLRRCVAGDPAAGLRQGADGSSLSRLEQSLIFLTRDSHFQNSGLESGALHPQSDRRPMRTCDHSAGVAQNPNNVLALQAL